MGPEYTSCVEAKDWSDLNKAYLAVLIGVTVVAGLAAVFTAGLGALIALAAFLEALRYFLNWLLHGKLICLHRQSSSDCICGGPSGHIVCAIGEIATTENVGEDKNKLEQIDDDYAINLVLFPFDMNEFAQRGFVDWKPDFIVDKHSDAFSTYKKGLFDIATKPGQPQGDLVTRQPVPYGIPKEFGYLTTMVMLGGGSYFPYTDVVGRDAGSDEDARWADYAQKNKNQKPIRFSVPVLHCEFEGSRTHDMLAALEGFPFGGSFCKKNWLTKLICKVVAAVLAPVVLAAVALAWARNTKGSTDPALVGGGTIGPKDNVIVRGSWTFDTGHSGWNEIHAVQIVQRVYFVPGDPAKFKDFLHTWCERLAETPMSDGAPNVGPFLSVGVNKPQDVPAAELTLHAQRQPENQWELHPSVDGCQPSDQPPQPPATPVLPPIH